VATLVPIDEHQLEQRRGHEDRSDQVREQNETRAQPGAATSTAKAPNKHGECKQGRCMAATTFRTHRTQDSGRRTVKKIRRFAKPVRLLAL